VELGLVGGPGYGNEALIVPEGQREAGRWCTRRERYCCCVLPKWVALLLRAGTVFAASYPALYLFGHFAIYPGDSRVPTPAQLAPGACEEFTFQGAGGRSVPGIHCLRWSKSLGGDKKDAAAAPAIVFGGNAMNMYDTALSMPGLLPRGHTSWEVFSMSLPGFQYSPRRGWTSQSGALEDAKGLLAYVRERTGQDSVVIGWSLGSSLAAGLAAAGDAAGVKCVILGNPFTTMREEALAVTHGLVAPWVVLLDEWPTASWARSLRVPTIVVSGTEDRLIPPRMHTAVYNAVSSDKKRLIERQAAHMNFGAFARPLWEAIPEVCQTPASSTTTVR